MKMFKKYIPLIILTAFQLFLLLCSTTKYQKLDTLSDFTEDKITSIQKTTGENIYFVESSGIINKNNITVKKTARKEINKNNIKLLTTLFYRIGQPYKYKMITKDGQQYNVRSYNELNDESAWVEYDEEITIPLSEVKEIEILKRDHDKGGKWGFGIGFLIGTQWEIFRIFAENPSDKKSIEGDISNALFKSAGLGIVFHYIGVLVGATDKYVLTIPNNFLMDTNIDSTTQKIDMKKLKLF